MKKTNITNNKIISGIEKSFEINLGDIKKIIRDFHSEMSKGLSGTKSSLAMIPSFVDMPKGNETGRHIAVDLGGTNFRVLAVELKPNGRIDVIAENKFKLDKKTMTGKGEKFFDFIAKKIKDFVRTSKLGFGESIDLGFTFSFPIQQTSIASGVLLFWNKGFAAKNVVGKDVVRLLNLALERAGVEGIRVAALVNDTVGTLAAKSYSESNCDLGVILGTGTNACYPEKISKIKKTRGLETSSGNMIINIEWGNFNKLKPTIYDKAVDKNSSNRGRQQLEKMVSGMYLGEIARLIICDLTKKKILKPYNFKTEYLSEIEADSSKTLKSVKSLLKKLGVSNITDNDIRLIKKISEIVVTRSAYISAAAMAAVILWMDPKLKRKHTIAIDGSLYEKCPTYPERMQSAFKMLLKNRAGRIKFSLAKDGSGKGAAVIAAIAAQS